MSSYKIWVLLVAIAFCAGFVIGGSRYRAIANEYNEYRARAESDMGNLRFALDAIRARSETAERGLTEAIERLTEIKDRDRRINYLIEAIRATVKHLREISERANGFNENTPSLP